MDCALPPQRLFGTLHNARWVGASQRGTGSGWGFCPGQVALLLDQSSYLAHSWFGEKEQMQMLCVTHYVPRSVSIAHRALRLRCKVESALVLSPRDLLFSESCGGLCWEGLWCNPRPWRGCLAPPGAAPSAPQLQAGARPGGRRRIPVQGSHRSWAFTH